ncbi:hypothetical protein J4H63_14775 [Vibrio alginolyticus]|uniref:hypothetical protein n=1 Tax=Vibrio alginolyticus TaxID=663 RepID=UPI001BD2BD99|nr:hypothetical protein [Vibrio alginolyticus]MBS9970687.1 hypothetical protein [Vibrio alginolyticus]
MESLLTWFNQWQWVNVISFSVGIIGIFLSVIFYIKSKSTHIPKYQVAGLSLLSKGMKEVNGLKVSLNERSLDALSLTTVSFWNSGNRTLETTDFATSDILRVVFPKGTSILQVQIGYVTVDSNYVNAEVNHDESTVYMNFDYLSKNEGFTIEIFHDNLNPSKINLLGTVKGFGAPVKVTEQYEPFTDTYIRPRFEKMWDFTGGYKKISFWLLLPFIFIPMFITVFLDILSRPFIMIFSKSKVFDPKRRVKRFK